MSIKGRHDPMPPSHKNTFLVGNLCLAATSYGLKMAQPGIRNAKGSKSCFHAFLWPSVYSWRSAIRYQDTKRVQGIQIKFSGKFFCLLRSAVCKTTLGVKTFLFAKAEIPCKIFVGAPTIFCGNSLQQVQRISSGKVGVLPGAAGSAFCWNTTCQSRDPPARGNPESASFAQCPFCYRIVVALPFFRFFEVRIAADMHESFREQV